MKSLTVYALAMPALVAAQYYAPPPDGYDAYVKNVDWNKVSYSSGFGQYGGGGGGGQASPTPPPTSSSVAPLNPYGPPASSTVAPLNPYGGGGGGGASSPSSGPSSTTSDSSSPQSTSSASSNSPSDKPSNPGSSTCGANQQSIEIQNNSGKTLNIVGGAPWTHGNCGSIPSGHPCTICQERSNTGGNLQLNGARGTWIEGNWDSDQPKACMDISYIPGFSVPVVCTNRAGETVGSSASLCSDSACSNCKDASDQGSVITGVTYQNGVCQNPTGDPGNKYVDGPSPFFFAKVEKEAYTFPNGDHLGKNPDNKVVAWDEHWSQVKCVVGPQFGGGGLSSYNKREPEAEAQPDVGSVEEKRDVATSPAHKHLGRRHKKRHTHGHGAVGGAKI